MFRYVVLGRKLPTMASNRNKFIPSYWTASAERPMDYRSFGARFTCDDTWTTNRFHDCYEQSHSTTKFTTGTPRNMRKPTPKMDSRKQDQMPHNKFSRPEHSRGTPSREVCKNNERKYKRSHAQWSGRFQQDDHKKHSRQRTSANRWLSRDLIQHDPGAPTKGLYNPHCFQRQTYSSSSSSSSMPDDHCLYKDRNTPISDSSERAKKHNDYREDQSSGTSPSTSLDSDVSDDTNNFRYRLERNWEDIDPPCELTENLSSSRKQIRIVSYNILSQKLLNLNKYLYKACNPRILPWQYRWKKLKEEIEQFDADVLCLQEVEECHYNDDLLPFLGGLNYQCNFKRRTGNNANKPDGVLIAFKKQHFRVCEEKKVEYFRGDVSPVNQDNVAVITILKPVFHESMTSSGCLCFVNTHLLYNPKRGDIKLAQLATLFSEIESILSKYKRSKVPIILCGDFNSIPRSFLYHFVTKEKMQYEGLEAQHVSGQKVKGGQGKVHHVPWPLLPGFMKITSNGCTLVPENSDAEHGTKTSSENRFKLQHSLGPLHSAYCHDEPRASTTQDKGVTVDYVFHSSYENGKESLLIYPTKRLSLIDPSDLRKVHGIPNAVHPSDHLPVVVDFALVQC